MKKKDMNVLIEGLRRLGRDMAELADALEGTAAAPRKQEAAAPPAEEGPAAVKEEEAPPWEEAAPEKVWTMEEVRTILADKARTGFRAEVKALLTAHGADRLSEITDPAVLADIAAQAEVIGNG